MRDSLAALLSLVLGHFRPPILQFLFVLARLPRRPRLASSHPAPSAGEGCCRTKLENAHGPVFRELLYPWHPWSRERVAVHEAIAKADGITFRCTLSGLDADRWLEIPAWMFERAACPDQSNLATSPFVSVSALTALSDLIVPVLKGLSTPSNALTPGASKSSHQQNRGEAHDHTDIVATNAGRGPKASAKLRFAADRSVRRHGGGIADEDTCVARVAGGDQKHTHQPSGAIDPGTRAGKQRRLAHGDQP
jgi:hypothetical protein